MPRRLMGQFFRAYCVHRSSSTGYNKAALTVAYEEGRPCYPPQGIDALVKGIDLTSYTHPSREKKGRSASSTLTTTTTNVRYHLLDMAAGTGMLTRDIFKYLEQEKHEVSTLRVAAVEPVQAMRETFSSLYPHVKLFNGTARNIPLEDACVERIVVGQGFHWFSNAASLCELARVLTPGGYLGLVWRTRDTTVPWIQELEDLIAPYYALGGGTPRQQTGEWREVFNESSFFTQLVNISSPRDPTMITSTIDVTLRSLLAHVLSLSVISCLARSEQQTVLAEVEAIFKRERERAPSDSDFSDAYANAGNQVKMRIVCEVYYARKND